MNKVVLLVVSLLFTSAAAECAAGAPVSRSAESSLVVHQDGSATGEVLVRSVTDPDGKPALALRVANHGSFCRDVLYRVVQDAAGRPVVDTSQPTWVYRFDDGGARPCSDAGGGGDLVVIDVPGPTDLAAIDEVILLLQSPGRVLRGDLGRLVVHDHKGFLQCHAGSDRWKVTAVYLDYGSTYDGSGQPIPQRLSPVAVLLRSTGACEDTNVSLRFPAGSDEVHLYVTRGFALPM